MSIHVKIVGTSEFISGYLAVELRRFKDLSVSTYCKNLTEPVEQIIEGSPDVLILDMYQDGPAALALADRVVEQVPEAKILILGIDDYHHGPSAVDAGARGHVWIKKSATELRSIIENIRQGQIVCPNEEEIREMSKQVLEGRRPPSPLSKRHLRCLTLIAKGYTNKEIVRELKCRPFTVKEHIRTILKVLKVGSRYEAADLARKHRWIKAG